MRYVHSPEGGSGRYSITSFIVQPRILHSASNVFVETDSFALILRIVELLICPFTCNVYVVAPRAFIVFQSGA